MKRFFLLTDCYDTQHQGASHLKANLIKAFCSKGNEEGIKTSNTDIRTRS